MTTFPSDGKRPIIFDPSVPTREMGAGREPVIDWHQTHVFEDKHATATYPLDVGTSDKAEVACIPTEDATASELGLASQLGPILAEHADPAITREITPPNRLRSSIAAAGALAALPVVALISQFGPFSVGGASTLERTAPAAVSTSTSETAQEQGAYVDDDGGMAHGVSKLVDDVVDRGGRSIFQGIISRNTRRGGVFGSLDITAMTTVPPRRTTPSTTSTSTTEPQPTTEPAISAVPIVETSLTTIIEEPTTTNDVDTSTSETTADTTQPDVTATSTTTGSTTTPSTSG